MERLTTEKHLTVAELLTVQELAEKLKVKKSWVYSRTRETGPEAMPRICLGKYRRFKIEDVLAWCETQSDI